MSKRKRTKKQKIIYQHTIEEDQIARLLDRKLKCIKEIYKKPSADEGIK